MRYAPQKRISAPPACLLLVLTLAPRLLLGSQRDSMTSSQETSNLVVTISLEKRTFAVGETIPLQVQISNRGKESILIGNNVSLGGDVANLDLTIQDSSSRISPKTDMTHDMFPASVTPNALSSFLKSWMLLKPGNSLITTVSIGSEIFSFLGKPGSYTLYGEYYSDGLSYPPTYRSRGLTEGDVNSIPFSCWRGKIDTNKIHLRVVSAPRRRGTN